MRRITEEIQVVGKAPKNVPLATVTTVGATDIAKLKSPGPRRRRQVHPRRPGHVRRQGHLLPQAPGHRLQPHRPSRRRRAGL
ncbi:MAG: hypothetical protein M0C28_02655 [Candidatus Moduliflexus flocculans]|nr:hypothetical protein [Candidatus Moduliflexus flocculans]